VSTPPPSAGKSTGTWVRELLGIAQDVPNEDNRHIRLVGQPVTLSRTPSKMAARPPEFGEQTEEVLAEFGFTVEEIGALRRDKVV
jgi:crotonobetainyl-CoA:carnitine CoA-transferase CaiB-like acyl-CoA transferase